MSSIRSLATITLLAAIGVFLYLKLNETEPPLPADIAGWTMPEEIEIGGQSAATSAGSPFGTAPTGSSAPAFNATPPMGGAPAFDPHLSTPPPTAQTPARGGGTTATPDASATSPGVSDLPPLPDLPSAANPESIANQAPPAHDHDHSAEVPTSPPRVPSALESSAARNPPPLASANSASSASESSAPQAQASLFSATRLAVQAALDRGELSQALLLLSDWYGDPSLSDAESQEVDRLLSQLAGSVIYSTEHRLEPPYMVQAGERLEDIAKKYNVPWQLLAKINGIARPDQLQPGQQLKVVRGPFSALIDLSERKMTLMLDRRYAGRFPINVDPTTSVEEGHWTVDQKLLTPGNSPLQATAPTTPTEQRTLMLTNPTGGSNQVVILRGEQSAPPAAGPTGRVIRLKSSDVQDVFDILSLGSRVTIRR